MKFHYFSITAAIFPKYPWLFQAWQMHFQIPWRFMTCVNLVFVKRLTNALSLPPPSPIPAAKEPRGLSFYTGECKQAKQQST